MKLHPENALLFSGRGITQAKMKNCLDRVSNVDFFVKVSDYVAMVAVQSRAQPMVR
jgi:hypothetical protein